MEMRYNFYLKKVFDAVESSTIGVQAYTFVGQVTFPSLILVTFNLDISLCNMTNIKNSTHFFCQFSDFLERSWVKTFFVSFCLITLLKVCLLTQIFLRNSMYFISYTEVYLLINHIYKVTLKINCSLPSLVEAFIVKKLQFLKLETGCVFGEILTFFIFSLQFFSKSFWKRQANV